MGLFAVKVLSWSIIKISEIILLVSLKLNLFIILQSYFCITIFNMYNIQKITLNYGVISFTLSHVLDF